VVFGEDAGSRPPTASNELESNDGSAGLARRRICGGYTSLAQWSSVTRIVEVLAKQLDSRVEISRHPPRDDRVDHPLTAHIALLVAASARQAPA
jgi:hypothetical protein